MDEEYENCVNDVDTSQDYNDDNYNLSHEDIINNIYKLALNLEKYCKNRCIHLFNKADTINIIINELS